jgi:hypothetical protein
MSYFTYPPVLALFRVYQNLSPVLHNTSLIFVKLTSRVCMHTPTKWLSSNDIPIQLTPRHCDDYYCSWDVLLYPFTAFSFFSISTNIDSAYQPAGYSEQLTPRVISQSDTPPQVCPSRVLFTLSHYISYSIVTLIYWTIFYRFQSTLCMFGTMVPKFDFEWIDFIKLIPTKIDLKINQFIFWYSHIKVSWKINLKLKSII